MQDIDTEEYKELSNYIEGLGTIQNFISQYNSGAGLNDVSLRHLHHILRNPYRSIDRIQRLSRYFSNRFGVVKDVIEAFRNLPTLNGHLVWSNYDKPDKITKYEKKVYDLLDSIDVKQMVRDGLAEQAEAGTVVPVYRAKGNFVQFLDIDLLRINKQRNGRWVVEVDLSKISGKTTAEKTAQIDSLPDEVTLALYNQYRAKEASQFVEIKDARVLNLRGTRNFPFGFPLSLPAWGALLHKGLIEQVEKSVADRKIKAILVLFAKSISADKEGYKPPPKDLVNKYFKDLSNLIRKKDGWSSDWTNEKSSNETTAGTGVLSLPDFFKLEEIKLDTDLFEKEVYDKLENDIFAALGVSSALIYGGGNNSNYGVAQVNAEKFFRNIFAALEQWESFINDIIKSVLPKDLNCRFYFDRTTIGDRDKDIAAKKEFYLQTSIWIPWAEAVLGVPYSYALGLAEYQDAVLKVSEKIRPAQNAFTQSGDGQGGRPENNFTDNTDGNIKAKGSNSNSIPSPSDG